MPSIKVTKNKTTNKKVERINEILRSGSLIEKVEDSARAKIGQMLMANSKSAIVLKKEPENNPDFDFESKEAI